MNADPGQSPADAVISLAETHFGPVHDWQRRVIHWAFRGDGRQPLAINGRFIPAPEGERTDA